MEAVEAVELWVLHGGPVDTSSPAAHCILSSEHAGHTEWAGEEAGLVEGMHVVKHFHAVHEDVVYSIGNLCVPFLQVLEVSGLLLVLIHQVLNVLSIYPNGDGRGPVQNLLQLKTDKERGMVANTRMRSGLLQGCLCRRITCRPTRPAPLLQVRE